MSTQSPVRRRPTLRLFIALASSGLVTLTAGAILLNATMAARSSTRIAITQLVRASLELAAARVLGFLSGAEDALLLGHQILGGVAVDPESPALLERYFFDVLSARPDLTLMGAADEAGNFVMVRRMADSSLDTKLVTRGGKRVVWRDREVGATLVAAYAERVDPKDHYDPRERPWFRGAMATTGIFATGAYLFHTEHAPGITLALPFASSTGQRAVLCADIRLDDLSQFIGSIEVGHNGQAFLIDAKGTLIAAAPGSMPETPLAPFSATPNTPLRALATHGEFEAALSTITPKHKVLDLELAGSQHTAAIEQIVVRASAVEVPWVVGVLVPNADFASGIEEVTTRSILAGAGLIVAAVLLSLLITRRINRALGMLSKETAAIAQLHFDDRPRAEAGFREVDAVLDAFENMKLGLRAFQKYLPLKLVRKLLADQTEPRLGGEFLEITVFFSDIANFTSMTEAAHPMAMAERLGEYLGELTALIEEHQGTVLQYVGDEIMAVFGAPHRVPDHAAAALDAALACRIRTEAEGQPFRTRFGIHTAQVAVGHFGSSDRLYYGAIGDGINIASRLESANKFYGTTILVSEDTARRAEPAHRFRRVDRVILKGRAGPIDLYEPLPPPLPDGAPGTRDAWIDEYEASLKHYLNRDFVRAAAGFDRVLELRPTDGPSRIMRDRSRLYVDQPPAEAWGGAYAMTMK